MINVPLHFSIMTQVNNVLNITIQGHIIHTANTLGGQSSVVYKAVDPCQKHVVAKLILPNNSQSLREATKAAQLLRNEHLLCPLVLLQESTHRFYAITSLAEMSLSELIEQQRQTGQLFSIQFVVNVMIQVADGLKALHMAGRYNGNLKLSNVLLFDIDSNVIVKLTDYEGFPGSRMNR